jgi:transposase
MDRYVGLDAHAETCTLAVVSPSGRRLTSQVVETNGRALVDALRAMPGELHLCLEEGTQSAWLHEILEPYVKEVVVTVPRESRGPKDDLRDAWARAEELRIGAIATRVYKAPKQLTMLRAAARAYRMLTQDVVRAKNRLRAVLRSRGISADGDIYDAKTRIEPLKELTSGHRQLAECLGRELDALLPLRDQAEEWLLKESKAHPIIRKLATAPGMGPIRTSQLVAIAATPYRFRTRRQFWSYCGLGVVTRSSSDWKRAKDGRWVRAEIQQTRGLNRNRQPLLKAVFKAAALTVTQMTDHPLRKDYDRMLRAGIKPNLAKLTLARRIAATVLSMWKHGEVYDPDRQKVMTEPSTAPL